MTKKNEVLLIISQKILGKNVTKVQRVILAEL